MKIYETIKATVEQEIKNERNKIRAETDGGFRDTEISEIKRMGMTLAINSLEKLILGRL